MNDLHTFVKLTKREKQIMEMLKQDLEHSHMAERLGITGSNVSAILSRLLKKTGVKNCADALSFVSKKSG
jgi:DNA-binding CsgD family transcriptional regulator